MRVLVTGAGGFAGRHLVRELKSAGYEVLGTRLPEHMDGAEGDPAIDWIPMDLADPDSVREAVRAVAPDGVFHLAAQSSVGQSFGDPAGTWRVNAGGTVDLALALEQLSKPVRVLFASSAEVYGSVPAAEQPIPEHSPLRPRSMYASSKAAAELALQQIGISDQLDVRIARSFNHTGPGQSPTFALPNFAAQIRGASRDTRPVVLRVGDLSVRRDFLDVRDAVGAYRRIFEAGEPGGTYNVASGTPHTLRSLVERLVEASGKQVEIVRDPSRVRPVDIPILSGDPSLLDALGWRRTIPIERTLADLYASTEVDA